MPAELTAKYKELAEQADAEQAAEYDFVKKNIMDAGDVRATKMANQQARLIHKYRQNHPSPQRRNLYATQTVESIKTTGYQPLYEQKALRQCECHIQKPTRAPKGTDGLINLEQKKLNGINSRCYSSLQQGMNLRLKPFKTVAKLREMTKHYRQTEGQLAEAQIERDMMMPQDHLQETNMIANRAPMLRAYTQR